MAKDTALTETKMLEEGRWLCDKGRWQNEGQADDLTRQAERGLVFVAGGFGNAFFWKLIFW